MSLVDELLALKAPKSDLAETTLPASEVEAPPDASLVDALLAVGGPKDGKPRGVRLTPELLASYFPETAVAAGAPVRELPPEISGRLLPRTPEEWESYRASFGPRPPPVVRQAEGPETVPRWPQPLLKEIAQRWTRGMQALDVDLQVDALAGRGDPEGALRLRREFRARQALEPRPLEWGGVRESFLRAVESAPPFATGAARAGAAKLVVGALFLAHPATAPFAAYAGSGAGGYAGFDLWRRQQRGELYGQMMEDGVDAEVARWTSAVAAPVVAYIDFMQTSGMAPGLLGAAKETVRRGTLRAVVDAGKEYGWTVLAEAGQEGAQHFLSLVARKLAMYLDKSLPRGTHEEIALYDALVGGRDTVVGSIPTMAFLTLPGHLVVGSGRVGGVAWDAPQRSAQSLLRSLEGPRLGELAALARTGTEAAAMKQAFGQSAGKFGAATPQVVDQGAIERILGRRLERRIGLLERVALVDAAREAIARQFAEEVAEPGKKAAEPEARAPEREEVERGEEGEIGKRGEIQVAEREVGEARRGEPERPGGVDRAPEVREEALRGAEPGREEGEVKVGPEPVSVSEAVQEAGEKARRVSLSKSARNRARRFEQEAARYFLLKQLPAEMLAAEPEMDAQRKEAAKRLAQMIKTDPSLEELVHPPEWHRAVEEAEAAAMREDDAGFKAATARKGSVETGELQKLVARYPSVAEKLREPLTRAGVWDRATVAAEPAAEMERAVPLPAMAEAEAVPEETEEIAPEETEEVAVEEAFADLGPARQAIMGRAIAAGLVTKAGRETVYGEAFRDALREISGRERLSEVTEPPQLEALSNWLVDWTGAPRPEEPVAKGQPEAKPGPGRARLAKKAKVVSALRAELEEAMPKAGVPSMEELLADAKPSEAFARFMQTRTPSQLAAFVETAGKRLRARKGEMLRRWNPEWADLARSIRGAQKYRRRALNALRRRVGAYWYPPEDELLAQLRGNPLTYTSRSDVAGDIDGILDGAKGRRLAVYSYVRRVPPGVRVYGIDEAMTELRPSYAPNAFIPADVQNEVDLVRHVVSLVEGRQRAGLRGAIERARSAAYKEEEIARAMSEDESGETEPVRDLSGQIANLEAAWGDAEEAVETLAQQLRDSLTREAVSVDLPRLREFRDRLLAESADADPKVVAERAARLRDIERKIAVAEQFIAEREAAEKKPKELRQRISVLALERGLAWKNRAGDTVWSRKATTIIKNASGVSKLGNVSEPEVLQTIFGMMGRARPEKIRGRRVIRLSTEADIAALYAHLEATGGTDAAHFERQMARLGIETPAYESPERFPTESEGQRLLRMMADEERFVRNEIETERALAANPDIARLVGEEEAAARAVWPEVGKVYAELFRRYGPDDLMGRAQELLPGAPLAEVAEANRIAGKDGAGLAEARRYVEEKAWPISAEASRFYSWRDFMGLLGERAGVFNFYPMVMELGGAKGRVHHRIEAVFERLVEAVGKEQFDTLVGSRSLQLALNRYIESGGKAPEGAPDWFAKYRTAWNEIDREVIQPVVRSQRIAWLLRENPGPGFYEAARREMPDVPTADLREAVRVLRTQGWEALRKFAEAKDWGVVRIDYASRTVGGVEVELGSARARAGGASTTYLRHRTAEYQIGEVPYLQALYSHLQNVFMRHEVLPEILTLLGIVNENIDKFADPKKLARTLNTAFLELQNYTAYENALAQIANRVYGYFIPVALGNPTAWLKQIMQPAMMDPNALAFFDPRNRKLTAEDLAFFDERIEPDSLRRGLLEEERTGLMSPVGYIRKAAEVLAWPFAQGDVINRRVPYYTGLNVAERASRQLERRLAEGVAVERAWDDFRRESGLLHLQSYQRRAALELLAREGHAAFARHVGMEISDRINLLYSRWQRSPAEHGPLGRAFGNLFVFPRGLAEVYVQDLLRMIDRHPVPGERAAAARDLAFLLTRSVLSGIVYAMITGRDEDAPYDPTAVLAYAVGGLQLAAMTQMARFMYYTLRSARGDSDAIGLAINTGVGLARASIPGVRLAFQSLDSFLGMQGVENYAVRKIREAVTAEMRKVIGWPKEYHVREEAYWVKRTWPQFVQHMVFGARAPRPKRSRPLPILLLGPGDAEEFLGVRGGRSAKPVTLGYRE